MNLNYDLDFTKGLRLEIDDLKNLFGGIHKTTNDLVKLISEEEFTNQSPIILYGLNITDHGGGSYSVSSGAILHLGNVIPFVGVSNQAASSENELKVNINKVNPSERVWGSDTNSAGISRETFSENVVEFEVGGGTHQINLMVRVQGFFILSPVSPWNTISGNSTNLPVVQKFARQFKMRGRISYAGTSTAAGVQAFDIALGLTPTGNRVLPITIERGSDLFAGHAQVNTDGKITFYPTNGGTLETGDIINLGAIHWDR
ncbi:MAG: hypothetical protein EP346_02260 [Bacteroidetes bacterium]|nr:MAG: hypothetical protein EP346_02260 [Bacteroidota bacterium]